MGKQLSIYDIDPEIKKPELWSCMETCANCGKVMGNFPTGEERCEYGYRRDLNPVIQEVDEHSIVHFYCKYYELK